MKEVLEKDRKFNMREFIKDPIGQAKNMVSSTDNKKEKLGKLIALSYYNDKLDKIENDLTKKLKEKTDDIKNLKINLSQLMIKGPADDQEFSWVDERGNSLSKFKWDGRTFVRQIEGAEKFFKTKGMENFQAIEQFANLAVNIIKPDYYDDFIANPGPYIRKLAKRIVNRPIRS